MIWRSGWEAGRFSEAVHCMIRYEIFSSVATSDQGLRDHPELLDLADSLAVKDIETRYVKQVVREEAQINVASSQYAKGLTVKETAVKTLRPQTSLRGCLIWLRAVTSRVDRGLHLEIEKVRNTNGAGLVLAQIFARGQHAFVSGLEDGNWERMVAQPDITLQKIPTEIAKSRELKNEYAQRGTRNPSQCPVVSTQFGTPGSRCATPTVVVERRFRRS